MNPIDQLFQQLRARGRKAFVAFLTAGDPDLPATAAAARELVRAAADDFKLVQLVTPTTPRDRALRIARRSTGFLYCVSVTGITGERARLPDGLREQLAWLRGQTDLPLCVGFGVSRPEHVRVLR